MIDKAHAEILEIIDSVSHKVFHLNKRIDAVLVANAKRHQQLEDKTTELENELLASIGETQELRDELRALKAWTEESLKKIHQSAEGHGGSSLKAVRGRD